MCRALIPKLAYDNNSLVFWTTCGPATTFDPKITGPNGTWFFDDGTTLDAASGVEISKTFATDGLHRAVFRPASGGLAAITVINAPSDLITCVENIQHTSLSTLLLYTNADLVLSLGILPKSITSYDLRTLPVLSGSLTDLSLNYAVLYITANSIVTGSLTDIRPTATLVYLFSDTLITAASISHLTAIQDIRIYSMSWNQTAVDLVIDSIYQAVVADANHFTYAGPIVLQIGGSGGTANAAPSGVYQEATPPTTGLEKVYYLCHLAAHTWAITWNGGSGP